MLGGVLLEGRDGRVGHEVSTVGNGKRLPRSDVGQPPAAESGEGGGDGCLPPRRERNETLGAYDEDRVSVDPGRQREDPTEVPRTSAAEWVDVILWEEGEPTLAEGQKISVVAETTEGAGRRAGSRGPRSNHESALEAGKNEREKEQSDAAGNYSRGSVDRSSQRLESTATAVQEDDNDAGDKFLQYTQPACGVYGESR
jgi:hypothetical protein